MRSLRVRAVLLTTLALVGCASAPAPRFYTLSERAAGDLVPVPNLDYSVEIGPVFVPDVVDRPQIVLTLPRNEVRIAEQARWAEPLREAIARAMASHMSRALANGRVSPRSQPGIAEADYRIVLDVQRFDSTLGEEATLELIWTVRRAKTGESRTGRSRVQEPISGPGFSELAAAHVRALETASRPIAEAVRALRQQDPAAGTGSGG